MLGVRFTVVVVGVVGLFLSAPTGADVLQVGRAEGAGRGFRIGLQVGTTRDFHANIQETRRKLYDVMGEEWKQDRANQFDFDDFNVSGTHPVIGLGLQRSGKYITFLLDGNYMSISSDAVARRDYFLGVDAVSYNGFSYDYMMIPDGAAFSFDVNGAALEARLQWTLFTLQPVQGIRVIPFLDAGVFGFAGRYSIDAGESRGVIQYLNPPEDFVVGGSVSGFSGMGLPEYGGGLEVRIGAIDEGQLVFHGHYAVCRYAGGTSFLTSSSHREKRAEIDHQNLRLRLYGEFPLNGGRSWILGGQFQQISSEGLIESGASDEAEIIALRERFDKEFKFDMTMVNVMLGLRF